jgi:hypothetical protein
MSNGGVEMMKILEVIGNGFVELHFEDGRKILIDRFDDEFWEVNGRIYRNFNDLLKEEFPSIEISEIEIV